MLHWSLFSLLLPFNLTFYYFIRKMFIHYILCIQEQILNIHKRKKKRKKGKLKVVTFFINLIIFDFYPQHYFYPSPIREKSNIGKHDKRWKGGGGNASHSLSRAELPAYQLRLIRFHFLLIIVSRLSVSDHHYFILINNHENSDSFNIFSSQPNQVLFITPFLISIHYKRSHYNFLETVIIFFRRQLQ